MSVTFNDIHCVYTISRSLFVVSFISLNVVCDSYQLLSLIKLALCKPSERHTHFHCNMLLFAVRLKSRPNNQDLKYKLWNVLYFFFHSQLLHCAWRLLTTTYCCILRFCIYSKYKIRKTSGSLFQFIKFSFAESHKTPAKFYSWLGR